MTKRRRSFRWPVWISLMALFLATPGCFLGYYPDYDQTCNGPGDLQVRWVFNSSPVCPEDATTIQIELLDDTNTPVTLNNQGEFDCTDREVILPALPCGDYQLRVHALDQDGNQDIVTYNASSLPVRVLPGRINPVTVDLQIAP